MMKGQVDIARIRLNLARRHLADFATFTDVRYQLNWHHALLCDYLDKLVSKEITRLMVFMPPRHGKSELVSRKLPAFIFGKNPDSQIIATSYSADLAQRMNRDVQRIIDSPVYGEVFPDTVLYGKNIRTVRNGAYMRNSDIFEIVGHRGAYRSAGVGGGITGMGANYIIVDDPIKNREEASSAVYRAKLWEWYTSTLYTRQEKNGAILVTLTRWHEDDLAGRLLEQINKNKDAEKWEVLLLPALCEAEDCHPQEPRQEGEALWPDKYDCNALAKIRATIGANQWAALYQQRPRPAEGGMYFKRSQIGDMISTIPADVIRWVRAWDLAATTDAESGDAAYTSGVLIGKRKNGRYVVADVINGRMSANDVRQTVKHTAQMDKERLKQVRIRLPQDPGQAGKEQAQSYIKFLSGFDVTAVLESGSKEVRAEPMAAQWQAGNFDVLVAPWNETYFNQLESFPAGKFKDMVDASSSAFTELELKNVFDIRALT